MKLVAVLLLSVILVSANAMTPYHEKEGLDNPGVDFLDGFAHGINPTCYDDVKQCIQDISPETIKRIKEDIEDLDWKHIERSCKDIEDIVQIFKNVLDDCKSSKEDVQELLKKLTHALDVGNFIDAALDIITNPLKFARMIKDI